MQNEMEIFCKNVAFLRRYYRLTQKEMARRLEVSVYCIRMLERGRMPENLMLDVILTVLREFGIPLEQQFEQVLREEDLACLQKEHTCGMI